MNAWQSWSKQWEQTFVALVESLMKDADSGHDVTHVRRVVRNAIRIGEAERADPNVLLPAAWLHDCVAVPKNSPLRTQASRIAAEQAVKSLVEISYPAEHYSAIEHAIIAHSFSAGVPPQTIEAKVIQDADRLEAVGAIGIARCFMTGGALEQQLVHPTEPFPFDRTPDDKVYSVDHFFMKLLGLHKTMQTDSGRSECIARSQFLETYLSQLASELG